MSMPQAVEVCPRVLLPIGVSGNVDDAEVNPQPIGRRSSLWL